MKTKIRVPMVTDGQIINRRQVNYLLYPSGCVLNSRDRAVRFRQLLNSLHDEGFRAVELVDGSLKIENIK